MKLLQSLKPISTSLSPNTEKDDIRLAFNLLLQPWRWTVGDRAKQLEEEFKEYLGIKHAVSFNSGRSGLMAILEALGIGKGDEVILQAFTCNAAVNPILDKKAEPVFADIDDTLNLDPADLKKKITSRTKAVMVQHNFGWPARMEEISKIARENNLYLVEDCAHALGVKYKGKFCGTFGDAAFFSFARDKVISSVFGGMAITNTGITGKKLEGFQKALGYPKKSWIFQQLFHPLLMNWKVIPAYAVHPVLGRIVLGFFRKSNIISKSVYKEEKGGKVAKYFPKRFPEALAILAQNQFRKLERFNKHRREIADFYRKELKDFSAPLSVSPEGLEPVFMRYPVLIENDTDEMLRRARKERLFLDDGWRKNIIVPSDTDLGKMKYIPGSCPKAEKVAQGIINLPTHINVSRKEAGKIVKFLKRYGG